MYMLMIVAVTIRLAFCAKNICMVYRYDVVCMFVKDTHETGENREWGEILLKQCLYIHL